MEILATKYLENPEKYPSLENFDGKEKLFQFWRYNSLSICSSWTLRETKNIFYVRRLEWDRWKDSAWPKGDPTIYGSETEIQDILAIGLVLELDSIVPDLTDCKSHSGIDGIFWGLETQTNYGYKRLTWWSTPAQELKILSLWLNTTLRLFDDLLPSATSRTNCLDFCRLNADIL